MIRSASRGRVLSTRLPSELVQVSEQYQKIMDFCKNLPQANNFVKNFFLKIKNIFNFNKNILTK
jgi:hypothetical protein